MASSSAARKASSFVWSRMHGACTRAGRGSSAQCGADGAKGPGRRLFLLSGPSVLSPQSSALEKAILPIPLSSPARAVRETHLRHEIEHLRRLVRREAVRLAEEVEAPLVDRRCEPEPRERRFEEAR